MKKLIVALAMTSLMVMAIGISNVLAKPKPKEGNPGLPGCLAKVDQLQAELDAMQNYAPVSQTGQTICYDALNNETDCAGTGQDGEHQTEVPWPDPRFSDRGDGTVRDNLTGLIWLKNADCFGEQTWFNALSACETLKSPACGLTDGSIASDWRLPNIKELQSLIDFGFYEPALPNTAGTGKWSEGNPFTGVLSNSYWSSTTYAQTTYSAWQMYMYIGRADYGVKTENIGYHVWPVRDAK